MFSDSRIYDKEDVRKRLCRIVSRVVGTAAEIRSNVKERMKYQKSFGSSPLRVGDVFVVIANGSLPFALLLFLLLSCAVLAT